MRLSTRFIHREKFFDFHRLCDGLAWGGVGAGGAPPPYPQSCVLIVAEASAVDREVTRGGPRQGRRVPGEASNRVGVALLASGNATGVSSG